MSISPSTSGPINKPTTRSTATSGILSFWAIRPVIVPNARMMPPEISVCFAISMEADAGKTFPPLRQLGSSSVLFLAAGGRLCREMLPQTLRDGKISARQRPVDWATLEPSFGTACCSAPTRVRRGRRPGLHQRGAALDRGDADCTGRAHDHPFRQRAADSEDRLTARRGGSPRRYASGDRRSRPLCRGRGGPNSPCLAPPIREDAAAEDQQFDRSLRR